MDELIQDKVKNATIKCLKKEFPNAKFYKDGTIKSYPSFYISFINIFINNDGIGESEYYRISLYIRIEYREKENPTNINNFNSLMDEVSFKMLKCLRKIRIEGKNYYTNITNNEVVDFVKIFEFNFSLMIQYEREQFEKMRKLEQTGRLKK